VGMGMNVHPRVNL